MALPVSLQLYTLRDLLAVDFEGTLAKVAKIGLKNVEFAGLYDRTPAQARKIIDKLGLKCSSMHGGLDQFKPEHLQATLDAAKTLGAGYVICAWIGEDLRTVEGYNTLGKIITEAQPKAQAQGVTLLYHNHSFEFAKLPNGKTGMEILLKSPEYTAVQMELDLYWVQHGWAKPLEWMTGLKGRVPLVHVKDMDTTVYRNFAEVGTGIIDWKPLIAAAPAAGVKYFVLEQDSNWKPSPLESVTTSFKNFTKMLAS
jgi:sugar phosphate isomerase/epimerase